MTKENIEKETLKPEEEEILTPEEVITLEGKTDEELTDVEKKNKKLYARTKAKDAENKTLKEKASELEAKIKELESKLNPTPTTPEQKVEAGKIVEQDPIEFAKKVRLLSTLDDEEISYAQILAKGTGTSVEQVIMTDDFKLWSNAHKEKIIQNKNNLSPSNKTERTEKEDEMFKKFSSNLPKGFEITNK
jgi:cell division protein FtsB